MWGRLSSSKLRLLACHGAQRQAWARVNTEALNFIAQGVGAVVEIDRIMPYTTADDHRLQPLLKKAKESFEMALEVESSNTDAMLFLSRLYMYYHIPGTSPASGAAMLEAAADAGNSVAQYELACRLRAEGKILCIGCDADGMDEKALKYLELAACKGLKEEVAENANRVNVQKHPDALFFMGSIYLAGKHIERDVKAAGWCFRNAADQGHVAAATVYGALMAKGILSSGTAQEMLDGQHNTVDDPNLDNAEQLTVEDDVSISEDMAKSARHYFEVAAEAGDRLALEWLNRIPTVENSSQNREIFEKSYPAQSVPDDSSQERKVH